MRADGGRSRSSKGDSYKDNAANAEDAPAPSAPTMSSEALHVEDFEPRRVPRARDTALSTGNKRSREASCARTNKLLWPSLAGPSPPLSHCVPRVKPGAAAGYASVTSPAATGPHPLPPPPAATATSSRAAQIVLGGTGARAQSSASSARGNSGDAAAAGMAVEDARELSASGASSSALSSGARAPPDQGRDNRLATAGQSSALPRMTRRTVRNCVCRGKSIIRHRKRMAQAST